MNRETYIENMATDMHSKVTIIVNSCDRYEDAWIPFFKLFEIQWPDCPYKIILNTESKSFVSESLDIATINFDEKGSWSKRLKNVLSQVDTEYVLYFLEDFFLESTVNVESFNKALQLLDSDKKIGYIGLKYNKSYTFKEEGKTFDSRPFLNKDELITCNRINSMTALWRKDWLLSLLRMHETPWDFEKYGSIRSRRSDKKVLIINNDVCPPVFHYEVDVEYGMGIYGGKWLENNRRLFEKYDIEVNFENLGMYGSLNSKTMVGAMQEKSNLREFLYGIKHYFKVKQRNIKKYINRIKSLM